ncbi:MAG: aminopeptidase [Candidatus Thorarchaeota archaeon]|nr:MAG: aminopeptidase [Candidatus Thorarchaeota archaeon]
MADHRTDQKMDPRIDEHARILVEWSTEVKRGDMVIITANPDAHDLVTAVTKYVARAGGSPTVIMNSQEFERAFFDAADDDTIQLFPKHVKAALEESDVLIGISSPVNTKALADVDPKKIMMRRIVQKEIGEIQIQKRWVGTVHPNRTLAQQANMGLEQYRDFVYGATLIDWEKESKNMYLMKEHLENHNDIRYVGPETDLHASTEGRIWVASVGKNNMPSGEVFTAPVEDTVEGHIYFDIPFMFQGKIIEGVRLKFEKGEVVDYSAEKSENVLKEILEVDEGSKRLGEMAIGTNRGIKRYTLNMLFDEKIGDTIHCALGRAYPDCNGTNTSAVHVDIIKSMKEGEIKAGDETIYSRGKYFFEK